VVRIRIGTTISLLVNLFLTFWLVNQYLNDVYFQNYVNTSIGPYSPFIVLTIGLGGGSGFGYVLLKRRHGDQGLVGKIQKSKSFKPGDPPHRRSAFRRVKAHSLRSTTITKELNPEQSKSQPEHDLVNKCQVLYRCVPGPETGRGGQERLRGITDVES